MVVEHFWNALPSHEYLTQFRRLPRGDAAVKLPAILAATVVDMRGHIDTPDLRIAAADKKSSTKQERGYLP